MPVYFVYRSPYDDPSGKRLKRFEEDTVLDWFRARWDDVVPASDPRDRIEELLGFYVYGFATFFEAAPDFDPPETDEELEALLQEHLYSEGPILYAPHLLTVKTDDDELELAYYLFDGHYLAQWRARAAYLLHEGWRLPGGHKEGGSFEPAEPTKEMWPAGTGPGATYFVFVAYEDSANLSNLENASRLPGVRIPELARYLASPRPWDNASDYLVLLRSQLFDRPATSDPLEETFRRAVLGVLEDEASWRAYSDWLQERGLPPVGLLALERGLAAVTGVPVADLGPARRWLCTHLPIENVDQLLADELDQHPRRATPDPAKSRVHVEEHLALLCLHTDCWGRTDLYHQWIIFDDLWAAAHPDLANSLLRYARCWDMLSPDGPHTET